MNLHRETRCSELLSNSVLLLPAVRLLLAIRKTQPTKPVAGVCLEGDTTIRLMTTMGLYRAGRINRVIVSGGIEEDDDLDERPASKMKEFLLNQGIPEEAIDVEERSRTTHEHPLFVGAIAEERGVTDLMIITSGYHLLRAYLRFLKVVLAEHHPYALYGYQAGSFGSWLRKTPAGGCCRIWTFFGMELTKIRTYQGLATFDEAWKYIRSLNAGR